MAMPAHSPETPEGGRIFFSGASRSLIEEDEIRLTSVGVDIGSSTAHLMFSKITLERLDARYVVAEREVIYASDILLTPYLPNGNIDTDRLAEFIDREYAASGIDRGDVDSGALILTGVAVRRQNARAIGNLFAKEAGKFVSVSAGDSLETVMAAHGSGAVAASAAGRTILNVDVGGGTTKLAICHDGKILAMTAVEAGARLVVTDDSDRIIRIEDFGTRTAQALGFDLALGAICDGAQKHQLAEELAARIGRAIRGREDTVWLRLAGLPRDVRFDGVIFSGGVSSFIYGDTSEKFGDLGAELAQALRAQAHDLALSVLPHANGIRATVIGASQFTVQVSGSTVFLDPAEILPLRNVATIKLDYDLAEEAIDPAGVAAALSAALARFDLGLGDEPVAVALKWQGSATFRRLDDLSYGLILGLKPLLAKGHPLVIVADSDIGGLLGIHFRENSMLDNAIVSIDGVELSDFDFVDIGEVLLSTGSVPVVIKSLIFPGEANTETANV